MYATLDASAGAWLQARQSPPFALTAPALLPSARALSGFCGVLSAVGVSRALAGPLCTRPLAYIARRAARCRRAGGQHSLVPAAGVRRRPLLAPRRPCHPRGVREVRVRGCGLVARRRWRAARGHRGDEVRGGAREDGLPVRHVVHQVVPRRCARRAPARASAAGSGAVARGAWGGAGRGWGAPARQAARMARRRSGRWRT
jgi:hypothetical protein